MLFFSRPALVKEFIRDLMGENSLSDARNGLFLAAPRRTGKSMFLRYDLTPALLAKGVTSLYVDLWEHKGEDPGTLIAAVIGKRADELRGRLQKVKDAVKGSVNLGPLSLDIDPSSIGKPGGISIPDALRRLHLATGKPVCLIVDEAQHALGSVEGMAAMAALKSARDQLNDAKSTNLLLVMSGSDRDKLMRLVNSNAAPFFGSQITRMPPLGDDYVAAIAKEIEVFLPRLKPIDIPELRHAFEVCDHRPQFFTGLIQAAFAEASDARSFKAELRKQANQQAESNRTGMTALYLGLSELQQAILWRMFLDGGKFKPFVADAMAFYAGKTGRKVSTTAVQAALEKLRTQDDPIVWKSARGEYSLEDAGMTRWFKGLLEAGNWPPTRG